jgi:GMP synthase (glutamine-hydrolysing)
VTSSRATLGDYEVWFRDVCGAEVVPVEVHAGEAPSAEQRFDALIISGSPRSVTEPEAWMAAAADFALAAAGQGTPVLGVCFGHQLLAWRLGGQVERNPKGRELGTVMVELSEPGQASALFAGFPAQFEVQATHEDVVTRLPDGALRLAFNGAAEVQAFSWGPRVFGVQFHPEMDATSIRACIESPLTTETQRAGAVARETPWGRRLLENFLSVGERTSQAAR